MRLIQAVPQVEEKIESGELSLTAAAKVQTFFQAERKENKSYSVEQKLEVINECLSKSTREVERELASRNPDVAKIEYLKPVGRDRFQISFSISQKAEEKMKRLISLFAHSNPNMTTEELFEKLLELGLEKYDPVRKAQRSNLFAEKKEALRAHEVKAAPHDAELNLENERGASRSQRLNTQSVTCTTVEEHQNMAFEIAEKYQNATRRIAEKKSSKLESMSPDKRSTSTSRRSRYIPAKTKHKVWLRNAGAGCEHLCSSGERCGETRALQLDHIHGFARGGEHAESNLRIMCARHNRAVWRANLKRVR